jgi:uncharacterized protein YbcC (UPF0753/DUF2309 family)
MNRSHTLGDRESSLEHAIEHLRHVLPAQGPIGTFVHHNTLHFVQHKPFHEAVREGADRTDAEPYFTEARFREELASGRITTEDLDYALERYRARTSERYSAPVNAHAIPRLAVQYGVHVARKSEIEFLVDERGLLKRFRADVPADARERIVRETWRWITESSDAQLDALNPHSSAAVLRERLSHDPEHAAVSALFAAARVVTRAVRGSPEPLLVRLNVDRTARDVLKLALGEDPCERADLWIVRFLSVFLDERVARWSMPHRDKGLLAAALAQLSTGRAVRNPALNRAAMVLEGAGRGAARALIMAVLDEFAVREEHWTAMIERQVLALPGWAGMVSRLESFPSDRAPDAPPVSLTEYVALRMVLDREFVRSAVQPWGVKDLSALGAAVAARHKGASHEGPVVSAFRLFQLAQLAGVDAAALLEAGEDGARSMLRVLDAFDPLERRRVFQEAYEHQHLRMVLSGVADNVKDPADPPEGDPRFQVVFCIDDREEAIRRHFEELHPGYRTYGVAGFFGIAMDWSSIDDPQVSAQCPLVVTPQHVVRELATDSHAELFRRRQARRALAARARRVVSDGTSSLVRGVALTPVIGVLAAWTMVTRVFFPRVSERFGRWIRERFVPTPKTVLSTTRGAIESAAQPEPLPPSAANVRETGSLKPQGFTADERVSRVRATLENIGLTSGFAPLVVLLGHGASTVNNPHHSAYECGACGGHNGGPNARAFAAMANDPEVRAGLREHAIDIPDSTWFIGGWHDTTTDAITLYDDEMPEKFQGNMRELRQALDKARGRSAHERCRKFEHAPAKLSDEEALAHVEERAVDLSQARPELGHATNAVAIVGRRELTRGLFLDRRAFLISYDPSEDASNAVLERILAAVVPVGAGINLEYYFSTVDNERWGAGTKLPHNLAALLGVQEGVSGDLRTGLPRQMIEIHEPVRLLCVVEAKPAALLQVAKNKPEVAELVGNGWVRLVSLDPETHELQVFEDGAFVHYDPDSIALPVHHRSEESYVGRTGSIPPAKIAPRRASNVASAEVQR